MVGYNPRCKLCNCEYRAEAEKMHEDGASLQQIADHLSSRGVALSKAAVKRHLDTHFAPKTEAAKRYYEESKNTMELAVNKRLDQLRMLDELIERNYRLHAGAANWAEEQLRKGGVFMESKPMIDLLNGASSEFRQAVKLRAELLGETDDNTIRVQFIDDLDDDDDA